MDNKTNNNSQQPEVKACKVGEKCSKSFEKSTEDVVCGIPTRNPPADTLMGNTKKENEVEDVKHANSLPAQTCRALGPESEDDISMYANMEDSK